MKSGYLETIDINNLLPTKNLETYRRSRPRSYMSYIFPRSYAQPNAARKCTIKQQLSNWFMHYRSVQRRYGKLLEVLIRHETCAFMSLMPFYREMVGKTARTQSIRPQHATRTSRNGHTAGLSAIGGNHSAKHLRPDLWRGRQVLPLVLVAI
jgi:hypothetical protein